MKMYARALGRRESKESNELLEEAESDMSEEKWSGPEWPLSSD